MQTAIPLSCSVTTSDPEQKHPDNPKLCSATLLSPITAILDFPKCNAGCPHQASAFQTTQRDWPNAASFARQKRFGKRAERNSGGKKAARKLSGVRAGCVCGVCGGETREKSRGPPHSWGTPPQVRLPSPPLRLSRVRAPLWACAHSSKENISCREFCQHVFPPSKEASTFKMSLCGWRIHSLLSVHPPFGDSYGFVWGERAQDFHYL